MNSNYHSPYDTSPNSFDTGESSNTFMRLNEYIHSELPSGEDDVSTIISNMVSENNLEGIDDELAENIAPDITPSFTDDGSVDLIYKQPPKASRTKITSSRRQNDNSKIEKKMLVPAKSSTNVPPSKSTSKKLISTTKSRSKTNTVTASVPKLKNGGKSAEFSLDSLLERLSKPEPEVALPPKAAWESKLRFLAGQIDSERENATKLTDIEEILERKKIKAKKDTEQAKWKYRVRDLESLLEEKRRLKQQKLRKLAVVLEALKKEKAEIKRYEKPVGRHARSRWASQNHDTDDNDSNHEGNEAVKKDDTQQREKQIKHVERRHNESARARRAVKEDRTTSFDYMDSFPIRPSGPERSASLVRAVEPRKVRRVRKSLNLSS